MSFMSRSGIRLDRYTGVTITQGAYNCGKPETLWELVNLLMLENSW